MPVDASIPLGVKTPDTFSTLGSITNLAKGVTDLQRSKVALEQDTGALKARRALAAAAQDPANIDPETGMLDLNKFSAAAQQADPDNYLASDYITKAATANHGLMTLKSAAMKLGDQGQEYIGQRLGALSLDPNLKKADIAAVLDDAVRVSGPAAGNVKSFRDIALKQLNGLADEPKALADGLRRFRQLATPVASQQPQTALVGTGAATVPVQTNPNAGAVGPMAGAQAVPNQVGPQAQETQAVDLAGNPYIQTRTPDGQIGAKPMPGAPRPLLAFPAGESQQSAEALRSARQAANAAAQRVPEQHFNNAQIVKLVDGAVTGAGSDKINALLTSAGLQGLTGDAGTDYNQIGHYIALQAQNNAQAMGAGTDAARGMSEQATASRGWTRDAIKKATKVNDALATGLELYNQGLERAINDPGNEKSIFAARDFQNAWGQSFDVNAARLYNAVRSGDKAESAAIMKELGGPGSPQAMAVAAKYRNLKRLVTGGE